MYVGVKPPEVARHDRDLGATLVFGLFGAAMIGLFFALRRIRARALSERADRELSEAIDEASKEDV